MRDIAEGIAAWQAAGTRYAVATVVGTWKSAPRQPGAAMAVAENGDVIGSVSGGCVEGAVYEAATEVIATGAPVLTTYGVSDDDAFQAGLTCGGIIDIYVRPAGPGHFPLLPGVLDAVAAGRPVAVASLLSGPPGPGETPLAEHDLVVTPETVAGTLGDARLDAGLVERARGMLARGATGTVRVGAEGEQRGDDVAVFVQSFAPPPRMLVFGAIDFAGAVARMGKFLGYHVTVCDARPVFATRKRFPDADELVVSWPHRFLDRTAVDENTVICVLTHDPKFDVPLLERALRTPARYVGAMGSRRTHEDRLRRLRELGVPESSLARLASPIGLDLGARTPEETAVAIMAEVIALAWGGTGRRLLNAPPGPIHH
ncbi:xanthine dehydrogenase accessory factor [Actinacidiphila alni]|uniref:Xanthine dehydrogenase accessory factor n=1 Tax=Actinacidiphila alni TaxID=380248 RepID=A0A1I1YQB4_9ACTN|nr:XdhC/CoxI family protein [Actinacidiphila alni]SFE21208.1 xanthine dehydrogenase accessory factor [Actinacidiphila alni]